MTDIARLTALNAQRWRTALIIRSGFDSVAKRLCASKDRYQAVERICGVPWWVIAVIHEREASQKWNTQLGQGDPLDKVSTHVPRGRGPFKTWEDGAVDALKNCAPYAAKWRDWSAGGTLTLLEEYNGLGYAGMGVPSPYVWSGTNQYVKGKYIADHDYDPNAGDKQLGCAGLLLAMRKIDPTIRFADEAPLPDVEPVPASKPDTVGTKHIATGTTGAAAGAALHVLGMPLWAALSAAFVVALIVYLILHNRK